MLRALTSVSASMILMALLAAPSALAQQKEEAPAENPEKAIEKHRREYNASVERKKEPGFEEDVRGRDEWFYFQRRFPYDYIPAGARARAVIETRKMEAKLAEQRAKGDRQAAVLAASRWEPIGPTNVGGRVSAVAQHPTKPGTIFVGAASGGVWKTTDDGGHWSTTFDKQEALSVGALGIDYTDPKVIYAGTGENHGHTEEYFGHGIFKSTDEGETWRNIGLTNVGGFSDIFVHRQNHLIVYAACTKEGGGFYRSEDSGATWTRTLSGMVYDMSVNPSNGEEIFISTANSVHYSSDGGRTFKNVTAGINTDNSTRLSVAMAPSNPKRVYVLMARLQPGDPNIADFYVSNDGGESWVFKKTFGSAFFNEQGFYNNCLAVHPDSANVVLAGGIDVYRTDDGGNNFINYTEAYLHLDDPTAVHADQHVLEFDPRNHSHVLVGNDGGLYRSEDGGMIWNRVTLNLPITQFYKMDVDQNDVTKVYGGTQDNGSTGSITGTEGGWVSVGGADGFFVVADPLQSGIVYTEIYYGTPIYRVDISDPTNRVPIDWQIEQVFGERGDWSTPLLMGYSDARLYSGRRNLWRTADGGGNWERLRPGNNGLMSAVGVTSSIDDAGKIIIGTSIGELRYTLDDGRTWRASTGGPGRAVSDLRYDPINSRRVYATFSGVGSGHVYRSDDYGATFVNISANLPNAPVNAIAIDPVNNEHLFVGTDAGAFVSLNGGRVWLPFNEGLPLAPVVDLKIHTASRTLIAATHGRSMFKINITDIEGQPLLINPLANVKYNTPGSLAVSWVGLNPPVRVSISYDGGANYTTMADNVMADSVSLSLPLVKTTMARVKVEEIASSTRAVVSGTFSLSAESNGSESGKKGFVAEAIEYRRGYIWATVRDSDSLYKFRLPFLGGRTGLVRSGVPGRVIDMAYDSTADFFYMLTTESDFSSPKLYRMDSNGVGQGEVTLPVAITHARGIAKTAEGLAIISPAPASEIFIINDGGELLRRTGALAGSTESDRRGLAWDGSGLVQGVILADTAAWFPSQLEKIGLGTTAHVGQKIPAVLAADKNIDFFGLAVETTNPAGLVYWATDTAGVFYKFLQLFSGVSEEGVTGRRAQGISLEGVTPNPFRSETKIRFTSRTAQYVTLELYSTDGERVARLFEGMAEAGEQSVMMKGDGLASGIYYLVLNAGNGERDVRSVVVMK